MEKMKYIQLRDVCDLIPGFAFKSGDFGEYDNRAIKIGDIQPPYVNEEGLIGVDISNYSKERLDKFKVHYGDFVLAMTGATIGKIGRFVGDSVAYINQRVLLFRPHATVNKEYVYYSLQSPVFQQYIFNHIDSQTAQPNISAGSVSGFEIPLPSRNEQDRIADLLSCIDNKIELNNRINHNLEEQLTLLYHQYFNDKSCNMIALGKVIKTTSGGTPSRSVESYYGPEIPWVKSKELHGGYIVNTEESITTEGLANSSAKLLPSHCVLIAMYGATVGEFGITSMPATCNQAICALIPNDNYPFSYLYIYAKDIKETLMNSAVGSAQQNISQVIIKELQVSSDLKKILDYNRIAEPILRNLELITQENVRMSMLRDSLLPKIMSGELNINELDC